MTLDSNERPIGMSYGSMASTTMEQKLTALRAENLAIQAVLTNVLFQLKQLDPVLADAIARSFDNAADQVERAGRTSEALVNALAIIEELRTASLGRDYRPRQTS
jgi:chemotaxis protein histidine kinase CheA